ncbi:cadherin-23 [Diorhabda carinulata]|uniref:cadherin-23 n=1 Tax=Diorhabda carinulata TaxID=1163345 RepID=UPI0025A0B79E|nr:cadherin-23 [Diorhabda carinulata]
MHLKLFKNFLRTFNGHFVKIKFKLVNTSRLCKLSNLVFVLLLFTSVSFVQCNKPPKFLTDGQTEIVIRLREGAETPVGSLIYKIQGFDEDNDYIKFGVSRFPGSDVIRIENITPTEANIYLNKELDREIQDEYSLVLTVTDGHLGYGNYVTQGLLLLVEDVNDNTPVFKSYQPTITVPEDLKPSTITTLEASDADEGAYGQVIYFLETVDEDQDLFAINTVGERAVLRLIGSLDYERQTVHQLKVLAVDRAKEGRVNTGTAAILIKVEDVEDQPPEFVRITPFVKVEENSPIGTSVSRVVAVDGDRGVNNSIEYYLHSNGLNKMSDFFSIERSTGVIFTTGILDREALPGESGTYILQITAKEIGSSIIPVPITITEMTVMITDVNDEKPTFKNSYYKCEIAENSPINTPLTFLGNASPEVYDYDQGVNGTFYLYVKGDVDAFDVTPSKVVNEATFMIRVKNSSLLDYENSKRFNLTLGAKEIIKRNPKYSEVAVIVNLLDRNDNFPEFSKSVYEVSVPENCEIGTTVAWIQAFDKDSGKFGTKGIRYTNLAGSIDHMLNLHLTTGVITVKIEGGPNWDREKISRHYLTVEARDDMGFGNRNSVQLIINIEDVNDNAPLFTQSKYEARLMENKLEFEQYLKVEALDADLNGTKNSEIEYELLGELASNFTIDRTTGVIEVKYPIDFESIQDSSSKSVCIIFLSVRARDLGTPSLFSQVPLSIYVEDVNDHVPIFENDYYNKSIVETSPSGTSIIQVKAQDFDGSSPNNQVVYRIQTGASDKFTIDAETGVIRVARGASLDPDSTQPRKTFYSLKVLAIDGAPGDKQLQNTADVNINIIDVNNKAPVISNLEPISIHENLQVGKVIANITASDPDTNARLVYKIDEKSCLAKNEKGSLLKYDDYDCAGSFNLDLYTGILSIAKLLDREIVEQFQLGVTVEDINTETGQQISFGSIQINIEDVNDNAPKFRKSFYKFIVTENSKHGTPIGAIAADDVDKNRTITYLLEGPRNLVNLFHLNTADGDIVVANKIDHEVYEWINLTVKATDSGFPPRSSRVELFIQILDENDNSPSFSPEPSTLIIPEDIHVGTEITKVEATDADSGEYAKITYLLDRLSSQGKFSLDSETGVLRVSEKLDREEKPTYLLIIEGWDNYQYGFNSGESRNAFKQINITIKDVNDNIPVLHVPEYCINITEFHEPGQPITRLHASDADDPDTGNGQVIIDIVDGNLHNLFELQTISEWSVDIRTTTSLRGRHGNYTVVLKAQDMGIPSLSVEEAVRICVTDYNDHPPVFISPPPNSTLKVPENATVGSALIQILATDEDIGSNGAVRYKLKTDPAGHWKFFELQPISGILELRLPFDRKKQKIYDIRIEAYDLGVPTPLSSELDLTVYVSDINNYQPQFMIDEYHVNFTENVSPEVEIRKLPDTVDRDEFEYDGPSRPVCYYIIGGNEDKMFHINPIDHTLMLTRKLDREEKDTYILLIKATEECNKSPKNQSFFDSDDDTQLKVVVKVLDVNDNAPKFIHRVFTGGVSTATSFGTKFMFVKAEDADEGSNSKISYYLVGNTQMTLTEGLDNLERAPFLVEKETGAIQLNFDPQRGMKGYFDFMVLANDTGGLLDTARVFIYLLREDQRVRFVLRQNPPEIRNRIETFREILGNVTGAIVNIDEFRIHANHDGSIDKTRTDLYLHLVDRKDNSILEVDEVLKLVDQNTEKLDSLFKDFNVLDTQPGGTLALKSQLQNANTTFWLSVSCLFLTLLLMLCLALCINQRQIYHRKLKAATATAFVSADSELEGRVLGGILSGRVPNTNKHSLEGSNPIWLKAYENEWFKNIDDISQSEHDSLDENVICYEDSLPTTDQIQDTQDRHQNLYQTLPVPASRKLETTEL